MYSQNNEEKVIIDFFKGKVGRFLDIGAYDGKTFSNTLRLAELGWSGVCVEPSPSCFKAMLPIHGNNERIELVNCAVGLNPGIIEFYDSNGDALSTSSVLHKEKWEKGYGSKYYKFYLNMITPKHLLDRFGYDYDFVNIDVESENFDLFKVFPFEKIKPRLICVEHDGKFDQMATIMHKMGYGIVDRNGENILFGK